MKSDKNIERPFCLELNDAKTEIFNSILEISRKHKVPFYLLEFILNEVFIQVSNNANQEREYAKNNYERKLSEAPAEEGK